MNSRTVTAGDLAASLDAAAKCFHQDELAYLALTSKIERPVQDRLAWSLHTRLPDLVVSREWRATDIAVLTADAGSPRVLLEIKAMYSFDLTPANPNALAYLKRIRNDLAKAWKLNHDGTADVYALALATHPHASPQHLPGVVKYLDDIERGLRDYGPGELRRMAETTMCQALPRLGPVRSGHLPGGTAFSTEVTIDYWLIGPVPQPA